MGRRRAGWTRLHISKPQRSSPEPEPGEGGDRSAGESKGSARHSLMRNYMIKDGGHSQASMSELQEPLREGGHNQACNGIKRYKFITAEGGHSQASRSKPHHYGHFGRYNDNMDF